MSGMVSSNCARFVSSYIKKVLRSELFLSSFYKNNCYSFKVPYELNIDPSLVNFNSIIVEVNHLLADEKVTDVRAIVTNDSHEPTITVNLKLSERDHYNSFEEICVEIEKYLMLEIEHSINVKEKINDLINHKFDSISEAYLYYTAEETSQPVLNEIFETSYKMEQVELKIENYAKVISDKLSPNHTPSEVSDFSLKLKEWMSYLAYLKFPMNNL